MTEPPGDAVVVEEGVPEEPAADPYRCYRCGSPHDPFQEYCLECGARLAPLPGGGVWRRDAWTRESPLWFWATLLALLLIALVTGAIVLAATGGEDDGRRRDTGRAALPATSGLGPPTGTTIEVPTTDTGLDPGTDTAPLPTPTATAPIPTFPPGTTAPFPTTTSPTTTGTTGTTGSNSTTVMSWPANQDGYSVLLRSIPEAQGRPAAEAEARRAINKGLRQVGVLNSSLFSSLRAGYWVVFYGIHDTEAQAAATVSSARNAGYPSAYVSEIAE